MRNINIPKFVQALLVPCKGAGLEVDAEGTKYLSMFCEHKAGQNHIVRIDNE
jgi:hypothetical protein